MKPIILVAAWRWSNTPGRGCCTHFAPCGAPSLPPRKLAALRALALAACLAATIAPARAGKPPELYDPIPVASRVTTGQNIDFHIHYKDAENDPPLEAGVIITSPGGNKTTIPVTDLNSIHSGSMLNMMEKPVESGAYRYYFFARDADGRTIFPEGGALEYHVQPSWLPWAVIGLGAVFSFLIISAIAYQVMHRSFRAQQTTSARVAILVGLTCWIACILYAIFVIGIQI